MPIAKFKVKAKSSEMILSDFPLFKLGPQKWTHSQ